MTSSSFWNYNQKLKSFVARGFYPVYLCTVSRHFLFTDLRKLNLRKDIDGDKTSRA